MERKRNTKPADGIWRRFRWFIFIPILVAFNNFFLLQIVHIQKSYRFRNEFDSLFSKINYLLVQITFSQLFFRNHQKNYFAMFLEIEGMRNVTKTYIYKQYLHANVENLQTTQVYLLKQELELHLDISFKIGSVVVR